MEVYDKNLQFFRKYLNNEYNTITLEESTYKSKVEHIDSSLNLIVENDNKRCFLHSAYDQNRENVKMFEKVNKDAERLIVFGLGFAHCIDYIIENFKSLRNITIIEPDLNVFRAIMQKVDMYEAIKKVGNATFIINKNPDEAINILFGENLNSLMEKTEVVYSLSYRNLYDKYYEILIDKIIEYTRFVLVNIATNEEFCYKWSENAFKNLKQRTVLLKNYLGKFNEIPAIIVSAGPSLNYNMHYLKEIKNNALIIAVGSAIKVLDSNGIVPHFRMAVDGCDGQKKLFENIDDNAAPLIFSDDFNAKVLDEYQGQKIRMSLDTTYIGQYFQNKLYNCNEVVRSGFSVANVALDVVSRLGCKKVIFMGQDLCYTEGSLYAKGAWKSQDNMEFSNEKYIQTQNTLGEIVYTDKPFMAMKGVFERLIKINPQIEYINATERGLNIEGTENKNFIQVMKEDLYEKFDIKNMISNIWEENKNEIFTVENNMENFILDLVCDLKNIDKINCTRLKRLKKLDRYFQNNLGINRLKSELEYIEEIENDLEQIDLYKEAVKPMIFDKFKVIYMNYCYNGDDEKIMFEKSLKALTGQTIELKRYIEFLLKVIQS